MSAGEFVQNFDGFTIWQSQNHKIEVDDVRFANWYLAQVLLYGTVYIVDKRDDSGKLIRQGMTASGVKLTFFDAPIEPGEPKKEWQTANSQAADGLSDLELHLLDLTAELANGIGRVIKEAPHERPGGVGAIADPDCGRNDWNEAAQLIHRLQEFIASQAAARRHPDQLRLHGTSFQAAKKKEEGS